MKKLQRKKPKKKPAPPVTPGLDHGWPRSIAIVTAWDFKDNLRKGGVIACAYGEDYSEDCESVVPVVTLVGTDGDALKQAMLQFKAWTDATGPDALSVDILFKDVGYEISFSADHQHLLWRTVGLQRAEPQVFNVSYIKRIDGRHPFLEKFASYAQLPVAPVLLGAATCTMPTTPKTPPDIRTIWPIPGCPSILLLKLPVYRTDADVPGDSQVLTSARKLDKKALERSRSEYLDHTKSANAVFRRREEHLQSVAPATLHVLRTYQPFMDRLQHLEGRGFERWQLEQAAVNLRAWSLIGDVERGKIRTSDDFSRALTDSVEFDLPDWDSVLPDDEAIVAQAQRDLRCLLQSLKVKARSQDIEAAQKLLNVRGYLRREGTQ